MGFGSVAKIVGVAVLALAVTIGVIGQVAPTLFLKFNGGFILWAITGHTVPPYFDSTPYVDGAHRSWLKDGDLVVSVGAKSGTTWMLYTTHLIRVKGDVENFPFDDPMLNTPWMEMTQSPGETWATRKELYNTTVLENGALLKDQWDNPKYPFRIFKSHFMPEGDSGPDVLPVKSRPKVKFLAMSRNFLDAVASLIPFFDSHSEEFRQMWGGFPPTSSADKAASVEERLTEVLPGGMLSPLYFGYVNGWWPLRNEPNVLLLHYADAKRDRAGTVAKIAAFMNVDLTKEQLNKIVHLTSIEEMRKLTDHFSYCLPLNQDFHGKVMKSGSMTRKGAVGEGKVVFSAEQQARAKAAEEAQFTDPALLNWARNGGGFD